MSLGTFLLSVSEWIYLQYHQSVWGFPFCHMDYCLDAWESKCGELHSYYKITWSTLWGGERGQLQTQAADWEAPSEVNLLPPLCKPQEGAGSPPLCQLTCFTSNCMRRATSCKVLGRVKDERCLKNTSLYCCLESASHRHWVCSSRERPTQISGTSDLRMTV